MLLMLDRVLESIVIIVWKYLQQFFTRYLAKFRRE